MNDKSSQEKPDPLKEKSFHLAIRMVRLYKYLAEEKKEFVIGRQILRSGTNPGAMVRESKNAESAEDFIHKLSVGQKEVAETQYWLELLFKTDYLSEKEYLSLIADANEVMRLLRSSILTKKNNINKKKTRQIVHSS